MRDGRVKQTSGWVDLPGDYLNLLTFSAITPTLLRLGLASLLDRSGSNSETPVLHRPRKKNLFRRFFPQIYDWKHLYLRICLVRHSVALPQLELHF